MYKTEGSVSEKYTINNFRFLQYSMSFHHYDNDKSYNEIELGLKSL